MAKKPAAATDKPAYYKEKPAKGPYKPCPKCGVFVHAKVSHCPKPECGAAFPATATKSPKAEKAETTKLDIPSVKNLVSQANALGGSKALRKGLAQMAELEKIFQPFGGAEGVKDVCDLMEELNAK